MHQRIVVVLSHFFVFACFCCGAASGCAAESPTAPAIEQGGYTKDSRAAYWSGHAIDGADVATFSPLPLTAAVFAADSDSLRDVEEGILSHLAWDKNHLYHDGRVIHSFQYPLEKLYPPQDRTPAKSSLLFARDEAGIIAITASPGVRHLANVIRLFNADRSHFATAEGFRVLGKLAPDAIVSVNADTLFYNALAVPGVSPNKARVFIFGGRKGVVTENSVVLEGYPRLYAVNRVDGQRVALGDKGFAHWEASRENEETIVRAFDGRFTITFGKEIHLKARGKKHAEWVLSR